MDELLTSAHNLAGSLVDDRRVIHRHPELAYHETETAAFVSRRLRELDIEVQTSVGGTGVVGLLRGGRAGKTVLLRADMDALPIQEPGDLGFASDCLGVMHACGHDAHTAMMLGVARLLSERRESLAGAVKFMFQPAEEGGAGALRMVEQGLLEGPAVDAAFALHVDATRPAGLVTTRSGPTMASADTFTIEVRGKGGHAARPHTTIDPVVVASHIVVALQTLVSRETSPIEPAVLTVGGINAGTAFNVIPDTATIIGTIRTFSEDVRTLMEHRLSEVASGIAGAMRASASISYERLYPTLVNHVSGTELVAGVARETLGADATGERELVMGSEDFSYVLQRVPGAMFYLGVRNPSWPEDRNAHSPAFDLDESALPIGTAVMAATAIKFLSS